MTPLKPPSYNESPKSNSTSSSDSSTVKDIERQTKAIRDLTTAMKQLEQAAKSANRSVKDVSKTSYNTNANAGNNSSSAREEARRKREEEKAAKEKEKAAKEKEKKEKEEQTAQEKKDKELSAGRTAYYGAILKIVKTVFSMVKDTTNRIRQAGDSMLKATKTITGSGGNYWTGAAKSAGTRGAADLYQRIADLQRAEYGDTKVEDDIEELISEIKLWSSQIGESTDAVKKFNKTIVETTGRQTVLAGIERGLTTEHSTKIAKQLQELALRWIGNEVLANELPEKGGLYNSKNQAYILDSEQWNQMYEGLANIVMSGGGTVGPFTSAGWQGWAYNQGLYMPGVDYSDAAISDIIARYLGEQASLYYSTGDVQAGQALVAESKKQTMVLDHIGGSLASFDEVEQVSAFSTADTLEEAKKEVGESKLTNKTLDEQLEYLVKTYKLDDNQKQMVKDMLEWGITFDNIEKWLTDGKDINNLYTAIDNLRTKGVSANLVNTALTLDVDPNDLILKLEAPDSIELKLPDDVKAAFDKLATLFGDNNVEDYIQSLVDLGIINQATGDRLKGMNKTYHYSSSDISSILTSYYDAFGKMPDYSDEGISLKDNEPATKFVGTDDGISLIDNDDTDSGRVHTGSGREFATGGIINHRLSNVTVGEQGKEAIIPLNSQYGRDYLSSVMSEVLSRNESSNVDNSDTFVFNMNGSLYASDKRIPEEFALQMYNAIENIRKKKGVK